MPPYWNTKSIRINLKKLMDSISQHAQQWRTTLGELLTKRTADNIVSLRNEIKVSFKTLFDGVACTASNAKLTVFTVI